MADSYKRQVRLADIVPGTNPRRDFGDIDALAAAIEATGGQPVNPPVVVLDGSAYRLVDGERRVRALRKLHGDDGMADVLVFTSYDDAEEAVAMVATDAKQGLTDEERARGFQRMLQLGVSEPVVAKAMRRSVGDVRKASRVARIAPEQATLDQMIAAAEFEDEDEQRAVLEAGSRWASKAETIRREHERREKNAAIEAELARLGVEVVKEADRGAYGIGKWCYDADALTEWAADADLEGAVAVPYQWGSGYYVYLPLRDEPAEQPSPEQVAARERIDRIDSAMRELAEHLFREVATTDVMPHLSAAAGAMRAELDEDYGWIEADLREQKVAEPAMAEFLACPASMYELARWVSEGSGPLAWDEWVLEFLPPAIEDGYEPSEEDEWLLGQARAEAARLRKEQGDDAE